MPIPAPLTIPSGFGVAGTRRVALGDLIVGDTTEASGVRWKLTEFEWGSPQPDFETQKRPRAHGSTAGESFLTERVMPLSGTVHAPSQAALEDAFDRLSGAVALADFPMVVSEAGRVRHCMVRRSGAVLTSPITDTLGKWSVQVTALDPRKYGPLVSVSTSLPSSSGGRTYPATYPITYTGVTTSGVLQVMNEGNMSAPVWLRIDGPIPAGGWSVTHLGKNRRLTFATSLALGAGEFVEVDMDRREILAQGQSGRAGWVTSRGWFDLDPGLNEISFGAAVYDPAARLTLTTMSAWS